MKKLDFLNVLPPTTGKTRAYSLMQINGKPGLACFLDGEWIIDATCKSLNEMLDLGVVCEDSVRGWISQQCYTNH